MATSTATLSPTITTDAAFRTWAQAIHDAIVAMGLVNTTDTGQVDLTTAAKPGTTAAYAGYKIYRFDDTLQATKPVFIKVEYGTSDWAATRGGLRVAVGTGTNGAGTLTGSGSAGTPFKVGPGNADPASGAVSHFAGDAGRLLIGLYVNDTNSRGSFLAIDRTRADDGTPNGDGLFVWVVGQDSNVFQVWSYTGAVASYSNTPPPTLFPAGETTNVRGSDVALFPVFAPPRISLNPCSSMALYATSDIANLTQFSYNPDGNGAKTFIALSGLASNPSGVPTGAKAAIRYE